MYIHYLKIQPFILNRYSSSYVLSKLFQHLVNWLHSSNMEDSSIYENIKILHCFLNLHEFKIVKTEQIFKEILQKNLKFNRQAFILIQILGEILKLSFVSSEKGPKNYMQFWKTDSTHEFINGLRDIWKVTINTRERIMFTSALR